MSLDDQRELVGGEDVGDELKDRDIIVAKKEDKVVAMILYQNSN